MNAVLMRARSCSTVSATVMPGRNTPIGGSIRRPIVPCEYALSLMLQTEPLPHRGRKTRLVQRVEMKTRRAVREQPVAQVGDDIEIESANRRGIVAVAFELPADPAWNF